LPAIGRWPGGLDRSYPKAEGSDCNAAVTQARDEILAQKRELARPYVRRRAYDEDAAFELDRACPICNACSHRA
jgi:hypothetical protein